MGAEMEVVCPLCAVRFQAEAVTEHVESAHVGPVGDIFQCGEPGCQYKGQSLGRVGAHALTLGHRAILIRKIDCRSSAVLTALAQLQNRLFTRTDSYSLKAVQVNRVEAQSQTEPEGMEQDDNIEEYAAPDELSPEEEELIQSFSRSKEAVESEEEAVEEDSPMRKLGQGEIVRRGGSRTWSLETKLAAVECVTVEGRSRKSVARQLGTDPKTIRTWISGLDRIKQQIEKNKDED